MKRRQLVPLTVLAGTLSGAGLLHTATASTISRTQVSGPYRLVLQVGPPAQMNMHGSSDQMLRSAKATCIMPGGMGMPMKHTKQLTCTHHLELHVYRAAGGKVVNSRLVTMQLIGSTKGHTYMVPISVMENMSIGTKDLHYGNNIGVPAGTYTVKVRVNSVRTTFTGVSL